MIPLYFFLDRRLPEWLYLSIIGFGAILMLAGIPWIQTIFLTVAGWLGENYAAKAEIYAENAMFAVNRGLSIGFILNLAILIVVMFFKRKIDELPNGTIMLNMFALSLVLYYYCFELVEVRAGLHLLRRRPDRAHGRVAGPRYHRFTAHGTGGTTPVPGALSRHACYYALLLQLLPWHLPRGTAGCGLQSLPELYRI